MLIRPHLSPADNRRIQAMLLGNQNGDLRQQLLDGAPFLAELTHTAVPQRAAPGTTATFTRATTATVRDHEGVLRTAISGEARFEGARRVRNLLTQTTDTSGANWTKGTVTVSGEVITATAGAGNHWTYQSFTSTSGNKYIASVKAKAGTAGFIALGWGNAATSEGVYFNLTNGAKGTTNGTISGNISGPDDDGYYTCSINKTTPTGNVSVEIHTSDNQAITWSAAGTETVYVKELQLEDITGRADQTTPSEYVSVGVTSAPYYHGSMVDGVKCFPTDLSGNPLPTRYTYDAVSLNGQSGTYVSTQDSVANSITGDIDLRWYGVLNDWTPTTPAAVISKWDDAARRSYSMVVYTDGTIRGYTSADGSTITNNGITSTASVGFSNGAVGGVRMTYATATGKFNFYTSTDGESWTLLGAADVSGTASAIFNSTSIVELGGLLSSTAWFVDGSVRKAQIYNGINGTLAVDFNASRYAGGSTLTGSTGETWTLQGNAVIHPTNNPMLGYLAEGARANLCLQSNALTTTWTKDATLTLAQNAVGPDGATSAWTLTDASAIGASYISQDITLTAASYTMSFFVEKTTGAQSSYPVVLFYLAATTGLAGVTIDTTNGVATAWTAYTGFTGVNGSATCVSCNSTYWRVSLTFTGTAAAWTLRLYPAGTANATQSTGTLDLTTQGSAVFYGAQVELGSFASSYIATTTVAVTRNADILTYTGGDIPNLKTLMAGFRREVGVSNQGVVASLDTGAGTTTYGLAYLDNAATLYFQGANTTLQWQQTATNSYVADSDSRIAFSVAANDIKMSKDGVTQTADTTASAPSTTLLSVGHYAAGQFVFNGNVGPIYGWTRNQSQSELNAVTQ